MASRKSSLVVRNEVQENGPSLATVLPLDSCPWYKTRHLLKLNFIILSLVLFASANGYDGSMMNGLQALPQWQGFMNHPTGAWLGFVNAIQAFGTIIAVAPTSIIIQRYGRKAGIWCGYFFIITATAMQTAAPNVAVFVVARGLLGCASQFYGNTVPLLITEIAYPTHRGIVTALYNTGWYLGSLLAAWATFATRNYANSWAWRIPSILQILIPTLCFPGFLMAPESPRFLAANDRIEEAKSVLLTYHNGGVHSDVIDFELEEIASTIRMEQEAKQSTSWADLWSTKGNRQRLFISVTLGIFGQWNGVGVVSYYLVLVLQSAGITDVTQQTLLNGFIHLWNLILAVAAAFMVDRLGRRKLFMASCIGMLVSYICITGLSGSFAQTGTKSIGLAVIPFLFLYYGSYDIAFTPLLVAYPTEIWPYSLRARGLGMTLLSTQTAVGINIFVNPIALGAIGWKYYIVYVVFLVIITGTCWFCYPETKGHTLEEMAIIFDGKDAQVPQGQEVLGAIMKNGAEHVEVTSLGKEGAKV